MKIIPNTSPGIRWYHSLVEVAHIIYTMHSVVCLGVIFSFLTLIKLIYWANDDLYFKLRFIYIFSAFIIEQLHVYVIRFVKYAGLYKVYELLLHDSELSQIINKISVQTKLCLLLQTVLAKSNSIFPLNICMVNCLSC